MSQYSKAETVEKTNIIISAFDVTFDFVFPKMSKLLNLPPKSPMTCRTEVQNEKGEWVPIEPLKFRWVYDKEIKTERNVEEKSLKKMLTTSDRYGKLSA